MSKLVRFIYSSGYLKDVFFISSDTYKTALSITAGFYLAIFPAPGTITLLCIVFAFVFRLNLIVLQGMNWLFFPLQLALLYPFMKTGRLLFFNDSKILPPVLPENLSEAINPETLFHVMESLIGGILVWCLLFFSTGYFLFRLLLIIAARINHQKQLHML
jgi:uncharacterized protein (DUF2062 family)